MSSAKLIDWFNELLFGSSSPVSIKYPPEVIFIVRELQLRGIDLSRTIRNGGLTAAIYTIGSDLDILIQHLKQKDVKDAPLFRTTIVSHFYQQLRLVLDGGTFSDVLPTPSVKTDSEILESIQKGDVVDKNPPYQDATFWGSLARMMLLHRRPPGNLLQVDTPPIHYLQDIQTLYDIFCKKWGQIVSPFSLMLVPRKDYIDPIHWHSSKAFREFLKTKHPLAVLATSAFEKGVLNADFKSFPPDGVLSKFLQKVCIVNEAVASVQDTDTPPKLIDLFHRLLVLSGKDHLWQDEDFPQLKESDSSWLHLYEKVVSLEKENELLSRLLETASSNRVHR